MGRRLLWKGSVHVAGGSGTLPGRYPIILSALLITLQRLPGKRKTHSSVPRVPAGRPPVPLSLAMPGLLSLRAPVVMRGSGLRAPGVRFPLAEVKGWFREGKIREKEHDLDNY
jgi:hypothetical protein